MLIMIVRVNPLNVSPPEHGIEQPSQLLEELKQHQQQKKAPNDTTKERLVIRTRDPRKKYESLDPSTPY
jgi:hypothetical protein